MDYYEIGTIAMGSIFGVGLSHIIFDKITPLLRVIKNTGISFSQLNKRRALELDEAVFASTQWLQYPSIWERVHATRRSLPDAIKDEWDTSISGKTAAGPLLDLGNRFFNMHLFDRNTRMAVKEFYHSEPVRNYLSSD